VFLSDELGGSLPVYASEVSLIVFWFMIGADCLDMMRSEGAQVLHVSAQALL
jgi:hypothetical protein